MNLKEVGDLINAFENLDHEWGESYRLWGVHLQMWGDCTGYVVLELTRRDGGSPEANIVLAAFRHGVEKKLPFDSEEELVQVLSTPVKANIS